MNQFHRLFLYTIQRHTVISDLPEINSFQVNTTDVAIIHGPVVNNTVLCIRCHGKLGGAWNIGRSLSPWLLGTCRNIEIIQDMKCLKNTFSGRRLLWGCQLKESGAHKPGWRGEIPRKPEQSGTMPEGFHLQRAVIMFRQRAGL